MNNASVCCAEGWRLVYAGSRLTQSAESNYSPSEGEAIALSWSLDDAKNDVQGCLNLLITDHKPVMNIQHHL